MIFFGKFSSLGCNKLLINPDEAICCAKDATVFKNKITEYNTTMEKKGLDKIVSPNYANYILTSNNDYCVFVETSDRRYFILDCDNSIAGNKEYFNNLGKWIENENTP